MFDTCQTLNNSKPVITKSFTPLEHGREKMQNFPESRLSRSPNIHKNPPTLRGAFQSYLHSLTIALESMNWDTYEIT